MIKKAKAWIVTVVTFVLVITVILAIVLPISIINGKAPNGCVSTPHLFDIGDVITMRKEVMTGKFIVSLENEILNGSIPIAIMKHRAWTVPFTIDLMDIQEQGSAQAKGASYFLGRNVLLQSCQNDTDIPWLTMGHITQDYSFVLRSYKMINGLGHEVAKCRENIDLAANFDVLAVVNGSETSQVIASIQRQVFSFTDTWKIVVKSHIPSFDYRQLMFLVSVVSYLKK